MGLETMTINGGMQDAVAGGKIALHSAFLNDLMEMPELSGDSIARTVDMALARIVVQNCNLNWFNLAEPCSTVTELIKCNHLCMRYNSLEPADVFSVLFKAATQVLDMPLATMTMRWTQCARTHFVRTHRRSFKLAAGHASDSGSSARNTASSWATHSSILRRTSCRY